MALVTNKSFNGTTTAPKLPVCHTCLERKAGLFTLGPDGKPQCGDCAAGQGKPIPGHVVPHG